MLIEYEHLEIPSEFICPITLCLMMDPVICADGNTYDREAISRWWLEGHDTSPLTGLKLDNKNLIPNRALKSGIDKYLEMMPKEKRPKEVDKKAIFDGIKRILLKRAEEKINDSKVSSFGHCGIL